MYASILHHDEEVKERTTLNLGIHKPPEWLVF